MADTGELARPYAIAAFKQAQEEGKLSEWGDMLETLTLITKDPTMAGLIVNPKIHKEELVGLILDVAGERLSTTGQNLLRVLGEYGRLGLVSQIERLFLEERSRHEGRSEVTVISAFELSADQTKHLSNAMSERLGTEVNLTVEIDKDLIGGVLIRAGDLMIDASLRGRLMQLGQTLG